MKRGEVIHIAFADDHVAGRMSIADYLKKMGGISVDVQADNGIQLITRLESAKALPSICILDVNMPKMNGLETLKAVKAKWPDMRFLVMSAFPSEHLVIPMIRNGAGGYLLKTCYPKEIKEALIAIYNTGFYHSEFLSQQLLLEHVELTVDEMNVMRESCSDLTYAQIGAKLHKSRKSIDGYRDSLFRKLHVKSRSGLVLYAVQSGLVPIEHLSKSQPQDSQPTHQIMKLITLFSLYLFGIVFLTGCGNGGSATGGGTKADSPAASVNTFFGGYTGTEVFIPTDSANKMISSYLQSIDSGTEADSALHSLIFDADSLRAYLSNPDIRHVKVMFGHTLEYINALGPGHNVGYESGALTVIFGGYNAEGDYIFWQGNKVPNHGAPCPYNCVSSGTASSDLFPIIP